MIFRRVTIVGLGLIGGSLGLALRRKGLVRRVIGFSRHEATIRAALARGAIHDGDTELCPNWLGESDLVVISTPPKTVVPLAKQIARLTKHSFVLTDVTSTKGEIVSSLERILPSRISFVGSHPMAGSERSGIEAAEAHLFQGAACIVTPTTRTNKSALKNLSSLWRSVGGRVFTMSPARHDALVAQVSHVPHMAAAALLLGTSPKGFPLAAGSFSDMTRIALSDPELWAQIAATNAKELSRALDQFISTAKDLRRLVASKNSKKLQTLLRAAQKRRTQFVQ